jgi:polyisoprenoid-binding protein YceI
MLKKIAIVVAGLLIVAVIAAVVYYLMLTAPVEVSNQVPVAPTLSAGQTAPAPLLPTPTVNPTASPTSVPRVVNNTTTVAIATPTRQASPTATVSANTAGQVYRLDATQSKAYYEISEVFLNENNRLFTAVGTTNAIAGDVLLDRASPNASKVGEIVIDISQLRSDDSRRDNAIRRQWLESARYPLVTFKNTKLEGLPPSFSEGVEFSFKITGDMTIRKVTKPITWEVTAKLEGNTLRGLASVKLKLTDFEIPNPSLATLTVDNNFTLKLDFVAKAVQNN